MRRDARSSSPSVARSVVRFAGVFLVVACLLIGIWPLVAPGYTTAATALARPLFRWVEAPNASVIEARGAEIWVYRIVGPGEIAPFTWFDRYTFFAVVPLVALLVATPRLGWLGRIARLAIGIVALLFTHVAYLVASVQLSYAALRLTSVGPFVARTLDVWQIGVRVLWEAAPIAIWAVLTVGVWRRVLRKHQSEGPCRGPSTEAIGATG